MDGILIAAGLLFGSLFGALLSIRAWTHRNRPAAAAGALVLIGTAVAGLIAAWLPERTGPKWAEIAELALTLATGPVTLLLVAWLLPARIALALPVGFALAAFLLLAAVEARYGGDPVVYAVPIQLLYTLAGWLIFLRTAKGRPRAPAKSRARRQQALAATVLAAISLVNAASLTRLALPDVEALRPLVPATVSLVFIALLVAVLWVFLGRSARDLEEAPRAGSPQADLAARAAALIVGERLFRDPALNAALVADRLAVAPAALAEALRRSDQGGFAALLQSLRLAEAAKMLRDPRESATSIEAVGLLCGFRSRSAFYEAFQRRYRTTPGEWRARGTSLSGS